MRAAAAPTLMNGPVICASATPEIAADAVHDNASASTDARARRQTINATPSAAAMTPHIGHSPANTATVDAVISLR